jgi:hypothetical protein
MVEDLAAGDFAELSFAALLDCIVQPILICGEVVIICARVGVECALTAVPVLAANGWGLWDPSKDKW